MQEGETGWVFRWDDRHETLNFAGVSDHGNTETEMEDDGNVQK